MQIDTVKAYEALSAAIGDILAGEGARLQKIESCFMTALDHWEGVKEMLGDLEFGSEQEEINFFKTIKPRFTGLIEYFTQWYQALLFIPDSGAQTLLCFWKMELKRLERFYSAHDEFIRYYRRGRAELDRIYFVRARSGRNNLEQAGIYDLGNRCASSHDWLVGKIIGLGMYHTDIRHEVRRLEQELFRSKQHIKIIHYHPRRPNT